MSFYQENIEQIQQRDIVLYNKISFLENMSEKVTTGEAYNGEKIHILHDSKKEEVVSLESIYDPIYAAERFAEQFRNITNRSVLFLFGLGDGRVVRQMLSDRYPFCHCFVYEPSLEVFLLTLREWSMQDILQSEKLTIIIQGINDDETFSLLQKKVDHVLWKSFAFVSLPVYNILFEQDYIKCAELYQQCILLRKGELTTAIDFARTGMINEVKAQKWLIKAKAADSLIGRFPENIPCIVVAAGPSLEKNVEELRNARGKACIIAVDSAVRYLMEKDIKPDFICTIDAEKPPAMLKSLKLDGIPIFLSTSSNPKLLEEAGDFLPIYFSTINRYYRNMIKDRNHILWGTEGGGSVATMSFWLAVTLGFKIIILAGQDLAYTDMNSHAGTGKVTDDELDYHSLFEVEGYYGGKVIAPDDFKLYLDWYNRMISALDKTYIIVNATEGGARIQGVTQMPLKEAVQRYCNSGIDCQEVCQSVSAIWESRSDKRQFYVGLQKGLIKLRELEQYAKEGKDMVEEALHIIQLHTIPEYRVVAIERKLNEIIELFNHEELGGMLLERIVEANVKLAESNEEQVKDSLRWLQHRYEIRKEYFHDLYEAAKECIQLWNESLLELEDIYHFEDSI